MTEADVLDRVRAGELSYRQAAALLGISFSEVRYRVDPEQLERKRAYDRKRNRQTYRNLTGFQRNRELLRKRRHAALKRMAERNGRRNGPL